MKKNRISGILKNIEKKGNRLPHPVTIFLLLTVCVILLSEVFARSGVTAIYRQKTADGFAEVSAQAVGLLNPEGLRYILTRLISNFTGFAPLGTVLVAMLGVSVADGSGLIAAVLKRLVLNTPKRWITATVVFAGILSNVAADVGYVILIPLGAILFSAFGRHPIAGLAAAFAGVSGGFSANLLIGALDPMMSGITAEAANIYHPSYSVLPTANWYFMIVSTFVITLLGTVITERLVEPALGKYQGKSAPPPEGGHNEKRGLRWALAALLIFVGAVALTLLPGGILRHPETDSLFQDSPFINGLVPLIALCFALPGIFFGLGAGVFRKGKDIIACLNRGMETMGSYLVLSFFASQFVNYFSYTNLGMIVAAKGASFLESAGFTGLPLLLAFVLLTATVNLFMGSASAKWAIMAPVFVPMFMQLGFSPELTQVAYRIGDSVTNIISPLMSYFAVVIAFMEKYDKNAGVGTVISTMLPYSVVFLLGWSALLTVWYLCDLPLGPGAPLFIG